MCAMSSMSWCGRGEIGEEMRERDGELGEWVW